MAPDLLFTRDQRREALAKKLEEEVEQFIADGLELWVSAAHQAITEFRDPVEEESAAYWFISLGGNMLWAATVFFPTARVAAPVASLLGAALGSGTAGQVNKWMAQPLNEKSAREYAADQVAERADKLEAKLVEDAGLWVRHGLLNHLMAMQGIEIRHQRRGGDYSFEDVMDRLETPGAKAKNERRHYTYTDYLFRGLITRPDTIREDLRREMVKEMRGVLTSFTKQAREYTRNLGNVRYEYPDWEAYYEYTHPFAPVLAYTTRTPTSLQPDRQSGQVAALWKNGGPFREDPSDFMWRAIKNLPYPIPQPLPKRVS